MARIRLATLTLGALAVWLALSSPSRAADGARSDGTYSEVDAQEIIDHCWDISLELRSGSTNSMYYGFVETIICLKTQIIELAAPMFEPDVLSRARIEWLLIEMTHPTGELSRRLYNDHKKCYCGTLVANSALWGIAELYEQILRDVVSQRNAYRL